jgi:hypothetical protein
MRWPHRAVRSQLVRSSDAFRNKPGNRVVHLNIIANALAKWPSGHEVDLNRPIIIWVVRSTKRSRSDEYALIFLFIRFCLTGENLEAHIWRAPELG